MGIYEGEMTSDLRLLDFTLVDISALLSIAAQLKLVQFWIEERPDFNAYIAPKIKNMIKRVLDY